MFYEYEVLVGEWFLPALIFSPILGAYRGFL